MIDDTATDHRTFDEMLDDIDANIKRIRNEIAREDAAFAELTSR